MRTRIHSEHWKWIVWLFILILLNAIALAAGRGENRGGSRASANSTPQPAQAQQPSPPARAQAQSSPSRSSQSASASVSRTESGGSRSSASQAPMMQQQSSSAPIVRSSRSVSSQPSGQAAARSRSVQHEVIVAPSSQSLNVSSSRTVAKATVSVADNRPSDSRASITTKISSRPVEVQAKRTAPVLIDSAERITAPRQDPVVEVKKARPERNIESSSLETRPVRQERAVDATQAAASGTKTETRQDRFSVSDRQPGSRVEQINKPQVKESQNNTVASSSVPAVGSEKNRTDERSRTDPIRVRTEDIKAEPQRSRPSQSDGIRRDNNEWTNRPQSRDRSELVTAVSTKTSGTEKLLAADSSERSWHSSDSRWSRLRSKITAQADFDTRSRDSRPDKDGRMRRDEDRGRVVVNNNNISVDRGSSSDYHRPQISRHLISDIRSIHRDHRWSSHGSSFAFRWSDRSCGQVVLAPYNHYYGLSYYYPSYHRKYLFVSLGGYWPYSYRYQRYYWYGCHPYYWYGADVVLSPSPVVYDYTTYNYYTAPAAAVTTETAVATDLAEDAAATDAPLPQTQADICFANAVNAFEEGQYDNAVELFRQAVLMSPEDEILPFTYTQALFAVGDYALSAYVLREVMAKMPSEEPAVYFPRGLYKDDQILSDQIAKLEYEITIEPFSTDYQLLLGYQYLGIGQWDKAVNALEQAARNPLNVNIVTKLLDIAEKMEKDAKNTELGNQS